MTKLCFMPETGFPLRPDDLIHSRSAVLENTEKLIALDRLELEKVQPAAWGGFILQLSGSSRLEQWWSGRPDKKKHLWLDSSELDEFGTQLLLTRLINDRTSGGIYAALCTWSDAPKAAADLRIRCLGPALIKAQGSAIFPATAQEIAQQFKLAEQPLNSTAVPCYCRLKWGYLKRFSGPSIPAVLDYFNIAQPQDISLPVLFTLGANLALVLAFSPSVEELRIGLCCQWRTGLAIDNLGAWLRRFPSSGRPRARREITWVAPTCFSAVEPRPYDQANPALIDTPAPA
jgi:hypothetical protein